MNIEMSNNEYRDPTMNSLMNIQFFEIQFFEIQFFGLLDPYWTPIEIQFDTPIWNANA